MEFASVTTSISKLQGNVGVARAIYEYTKMGYTVLMPLSDSDKYDMVIDNGNQLLKVQVKTSRCQSPSGGYSINLKTSGGNTKTNTIRKRDSNDYDLLFTLVEDGRCWNIPTKDLGDAGSSIVVGASKYNEFQIGVRD